MDFYSSAFFTFLASVIGIHFLTPVRFRWIVLLVASYYFYGTFSIQYVVLIAASTTIAYFSALTMEKSESKSLKRKYFLAGVIANLGFLFVVKYFNFFNSSLAAILHVYDIPFRGHLLRFAVPVGISFYVFQIVSYLVDVYRGSITAEKHLGLLALYVSFFPKLLAGPIERAQQLIPQLHMKHTWDWELATNGFKLMVWGLFKKVVIADRLAVFVDIVFNNPSSYEGPSLILAIILYSFQMYCDFSGYTDIAIGISQIFGLRLMDNFDRPYTSRSVSEFWRRWHISLSSWLRDYVYIPLGGNRVVPSRLYLNLIIVFLICGLWHGASWTFVVWGLMHGLYLVIGLVSKNFRSKIVRALEINRIPSAHRVFQVCITFMLVSFAWIFFRAESLPDAFYISTHLHTGWSHLFTGNELESIFFLGRPRTELLIAVFCLVFLWIIHCVQSHDTMRSMLSGKPFYVRWPFYYVIVGAVLLLRAPGSEKFIYFQF